jgi:hypothetical protein
VNILPIAMRKARLRTMRPIERSWFVTDDAYYLILRFFVLIRWCDLIWFYI